MHRKPSIAIRPRPKTSSAADDCSALPSFEATMKRTASQTFSTHCEAREPSTLGAVEEGRSVEYRPAHTHAHTSSLSRASHVFGQIRRKLSSSSSSSRRPSIQDFLFDAPASSTTTLSSRKASTDLLRLPLPHQDSGLPQQEPSAALSAPKKSMLQRFSSIRRRPAASGPSGEFAKYNPVPPPIPSNYPSQAPGTAARQAAAAANDARRTQDKRDLEQTEQTRRFLEGGLPLDNVEEVIKDSESGVGMMCSSPINHTDGVQEKKMGK
jgi:F-box and WD-40 domain protein 1/11